MLSDKPSVAVQTEAEATRTKGNMDFDVDPMTLHLFFDLVTNKPVPKGTSWHGYKQVLGLCDMWDSPTIGEIALTRLQAMVGDAPWEIFCMASKV